MKSIKLLLLIMAAALITFGLNGSAMAFHDGGVAHCDGCHTMHNSESGQPVNEAQLPIGEGNAFLLVGADPSSTCLSCHEGSGSYHIFSDDGSNFSPGGDFYWMTKTFTYVTHGTHTSTSSNHGHNVIAADFGLDQDADISESPGGSYQAAWLGCQSCHNPHGTKEGDGAIVGSGSYGDDPLALPAGETYGNYRLLGDASYDGGQPTYDFINGAPTAVANHFSAESDGTAGNPVSHTAYGQDMSEWCANCHGGFLKATAAGDGHVHPAGNTEDLGGTISAIYNAYVKTGLANGTADSSYLQFVPFERGNGNVVQLLPFATTLDGPTAGSNVMCLSCHRAHASAFPNAGRWYFESEFIADSHPAAGDTGVTGDDVENSYYGRDMATEFGEFQRSLCNKCHGKD
jgi:hypothetical protein